MAQVLETFETVISRKVGCHYWRYVPREYGNSNEKWPLLIFLHGKGETAEVERVKRHGPPKLIAAGQELPFVVISPQCPEDHWWDPQTLIPLIDTVCATHAIDEERIYLTGLSMGGFGTWTLALTYPNRFAAIAPICGGGSPYVVDRIAHIPAWVFHGARDPVVPLYESERMVEALRRAGGDVKFTVYPEAEHDSWTETYANPELYEWFLGHRRRTRE
jgi:predicted peptidase